MHIQLPNLGSVKGADVITLYARIQSAVTVFLFPA